MSYQSIVLLHVGLPTYGHQGFQAVVRGWSIEACTYVLKATSGTHGAPDQ